MHVPMHWHSANETHTMIQGTAVFEHEGKRESLARAASTTSRPRCRTKHGLQRVALHNRMRERVGCLYHGRCCLGRELGRQPAQQN